MANNSKESSQKYLRITHWRGFAAARIENRHCCELEILRGHKRANFIMYSNALSIGSTLWAGNLARE